MNKLRKTGLGICITVFALCIASVASAHFGVVKPSDDIITQKDKKTIQVEVKFLHPHEGNYMEMAKPKQFGVMVGGQKIDLLNSLNPAKAKTTGQKQEFTFWKADYTIKRPGDYTFYVEPTPYWEPAEDSYIIHYTKVCVDALGLQEGWDTPVGLKTEIVPLTRPYGFWVGNVFSGVVLVDGKPAPNTDVEIEYLNEAAEGGKLPSPSDPYVTQVVKSDKNGVFTYAMPKAGWWGFAALSEGSEKIKGPDGKPKSVEIGAIYWVKVISIK
jgi:cobalt/nickel transport protein